MPFVHRDLVVAEDVRRALDVDAEHPLATAAGRELVARELGCFDDIPHERVVSLDDVEGSAACEPDDGERQPPALARPFRFLTCHAICAEEVAFERDGLVASGTNECAPAGVQHAVCGEGVAGDRDRRGAFRIVGFDVEPAASAESARHLVVAEAVVGDPQRAGHP